MSNPTNDKPSFKNVIKTTWRIFKQHLKPIAAIVILVYLPINLFMEFSPLVKMDSYDIEALLQVVRFSGLYELIIGSFAAILLILLTKRAYDGQKTTFGDLWSKEFNIKIYGRYLWTTFFKNLLIGICLLLLIVPGIVFGVFWLFAEQIAVLGDEGGTRALKISQALVKDKWFQIFWLMLAGILAALLPVNILTLGLQMYVKHWSVNLATSFLVDFGQGFFIIYLTVIYLELIKGQNAGSK